MNIDVIKSILGIKVLDADGVESLPFMPSDLTIGAENEYQVAVIGKPTDVDLPIAIQESSYYGNLVRRTASGDVSDSQLELLNSFISENDDNTWENSWVYFPLKRMNVFSRETFEADLKVDKDDPASTLRSDHDRFIVERKGETMIRVPVSYLLKLALADIVGTLEESDPALEPAVRLMDHYLNDNTSPEVHSFYVCKCGNASGMGKAIANETLQRFYFTQLLVAYANTKFGLEEHGQRVRLYFSPHPPVRQKKLNDMIPDSFYRELFINPCLAGWKRGEEKQEYMGLCHQVLSRSHLNAISKLKEAGIINNNLVVLPNTSSIGLSNNGTHVSLGSKKMTDIIADEKCDFSSVEEKELGDLVTKFFEHFSSLFVGTYSAAPYRLDFEDFHPEKALGMLAHELDFTHLRMMWRRWKKKAKLRFFGHAFAPFGPKWLDSLLSTVLRLRGDFVPDYRLVDYLVALLSSSQTPSLDGVLGNQDKLKKELQAAGVFDKKMSLYLTYKLRQREKIGYSGFEGRYYSQFHSISTDMTHSVNLQVLVTILAYKYIFDGRLKHEDIEDSQSVESARRQIFFSAAIGLPTFYIHKDTRDTFLMGVIDNTDKVRLSSRYPGYYRIHLNQYKKALYNILMHEASEIIEVLNIEETMEDLKQRITEPEAYSVAGKLAKDICNGAPKSMVMRMNGYEFNKSAECYYREDLRKKHICEALKVITEDCSKMDFAANMSESDLTKAFEKELGSEPAGEFFKKTKKDLNEDKLAPGEIIKSIKLLALIIESYNKNRR